LGAGDIEALAATDIFAHQHVVDANEIVSRFLKAHSVLFAGAPGQITLLSAFEPANLVIGTLATVGAAVAGAFYFLYFVEEIAFIHIFSIKVRQTSVCRWLVIHSIGIIDKLKFVGRVIPARRVREDT